MAAIEELNIDLSGGITKSQMESIINKINELVRVVNKSSSLEINLNQEYNDASRRFNLEEAIILAKDIKRAIGIRLKFLGRSGRYMEYSYTGATLEDIDWTNQDNWCIIVSIVDGGEF